MLDVRSCGAYYWYRRQILMPRHFNDGPRRILIIFADRLRTNCSPTFPHREKTVITQQDWY